MKPEQIRAATVLVRTPVSQGTAYLVSSTVLATCHHVVEAAGMGGRVEVLLGDSRVEAEVTALTGATDCALLTLATPLPGTAPLRLAAGCESQAVWDGYGYPNLASGAGVPFFGKVLEAESLDDRKRPMITLYSEMVAAGTAAPIHGLSGGPIVVDGAVVGHFSRILGTPGAEGKPALGVVYAARASNVLALLGKAADVELATVPAPPAISGQIPKLAPDEYHAFISYRSSDRNFATRLYERLDAFGLRVVLDQRELEPGDRSACTLQGTLDRCRTGVVLVSRGWLDSPWCREGGERAITRSKDEPGFRVLALRLEDIAMPEMFPTRPCGDFAGDSQPEGVKLDSVVYAVLGKTPPVDGSPESKLQRTDTSATDEALRRIDAMVQDVERDPRRFRSIVDYLQRAGLPVVAAKLRIADALIGAGWLRCALEILPPAEDSLRARQLRALCLSKLGENDAALALLAAQVERGQLDGESAGIVGGIYKRMWHQTRQPALLQKSFRTYQRAYACTGDSYTGINVATLALLLDRPDESRTVATRIASELGGKSRPLLSSWDEGTLAEALLDLDREDEALERYARASSSSLNRPQDIAVMRRQARLVYEKRGRSSYKLEQALHIPRIVAFSGHLTDAPDRAVPRFPENKVEGARRMIRNWLRARESATHAVCSAARGADLLFLEQVLEMNGTATVLLPFPKADFAEISVAFKNWLPRFEHVLAHERVSVRPPVRDRTPPAGPDLDQAFVECNDAIIAEAEHLAALFDDAQPLLLTLWNGAPGDGTGGTAHAHEAWRQRGFPTDNIDLSKLP